MRDLVRLPKAELHIHLEGSIRTDDDPRARGPAGAPGALGAGTQRMVVRSLRPLHRAVRRGVRSPQHRRGLPADRPRVLRRPRRHRGALRRGRVLPRAARRAPRRLDRADRGRAGWLRRGRARHRGGVQARARHHPRPRDGRGGGDARGRAEVRRPRGGRAELRGKRTQPARPVRGPLPSRAGRGPALGAARRRVERPAERLGDARHPGAGADRARRAVDRGSGARRSGSRSCGSRSRSAPPPTSAPASSRITRTTRSSACATPAWS